MKIRFSYWYASASICMMTMMFVGCGTDPAPQEPINPAVVGANLKLPARILGPATAQEAAAFMAEVERESLRLWIAASQAEWVKATYITDDTSALSARASEDVMAYIGQKAAESVRFDGLKLDPALTRKFQLLKIALTLPAPADAAKRAELARVATDLDAMYGKGKYCSKTLAAKWKKEVAKNDGCLNLNDLEDILTKSRNPAELFEAWQGWHKIAEPMRPLYERYVALGNEGAKSLGFANLGDVWKSRYDMTPAAFEAEVDRLWGQVKPLYDDLHCYVRGKLQAKYGKSVVADKAPIPAHLLGNMWAQEWSNISEMLMPGKSKPITIIPALKKKKIDERGMVRYGEAFFTSLGLDKLPQTFWDRSMFTRPRDRDVVCHASAWDLDYETDLRIKMCIKINDEDFGVIHHELGHNYYQYYYRHLPPMFRDSANDGFHEGLGDTISLSVTPEYLKKLGLLDKLPTDAVAPLMDRALGKVAFLPFGILIDKWRWDVLAGKVSAKDYTKHWWELRRQYQGIAPMGDRPPESFDPGAKYHIPGGVPYVRYFMAAILQFQFHRALCKVAGHQGPLHTCSIYENKAAGERLRAMMEMGLSQPWPEALKALTGETQMDATAILGYFEPLHAWLKEQNKNQQCGW